jgi:N-hydroxyarylamine O-acetyltransferase
MDTDGYLQRIGATRDTGLRELHRRHQLAVPFENLDIHLAVRVSLAPEDLYAKVVTRERGGFCYELNGLFALLLEDLGHTVTRLAARVGDGPPFDHLALVVDDAWLVDVGFGSHSTYPLRVDDQNPQTDPAGTFTVSPTADGDLQVTHDGKPAYRVERRPRVLPDFGPTCWWQQTSPDSHFTEKPLCTRLTPTGRITISGHTLIETRDGVRTETDLATPDALLAGYRHHFGVTLDRVPDLSFP